MTTAIKIVTPIVILFLADDEDDVDSAVAGAAAVGVSGVAGCR